MRFCDELEFGFGWIDETDRLRRTSHALVDDGRVWLVDPVDWPEALERARAAGEVTGVLQLLDRHARDAEKLALRLGVRLHRIPRGQIPGAPFEFLNVANTPVWSEVALWWPAPRTLVAADALGTIGYFRARGERIGLHPFARILPPRSLRRVFPRHILCGHGRGVHDEATEALHSAIRTARRRLPAAVANGFRRAR
jgi:hypothetical protein